MYYMRSVIEDPVSTWKRLQDKFERKTEMAAEAAQLQLLNFQLMETETADQTIERFELVLETCHHQGDPVSDQPQLRMLLARPNDRYLSLKKTHQHISTKPDLDSVFASMRDDDDYYQKSHASPAPR